VKAKRKLPLRLIVVFTALALVLAACGSDSKDNNNASSENQKKGGQLVFGAEQWPDCINPITQCANSSWMQWLVPIHVLPRLAELDKDNNFVASPLITELPSIENGGVKEGPPFSVTYKLNPDAKWDDGTPITSADVAFSWEAQMKTTGSLTTAGYDQVEKVETPDPQTATYVFKTTYLDWQDINGGFSGVVLQKSKFKSSDVSKDMQNAINFSGGPWILKSFSKEQAVLTANKNYWDKDRVPLLDQVTFVPRTDTNAEVQAVKSGEVAAIYPQPAADNVPQITGAPELKSAFGATTQYENIWFNQKPGKPFEDPNLREAFTYAFDRQKFIDEIVKPFNPDVEMLQCAAWIPEIADGKYCPGQDGPWGDVKPDPAKVEAAMKKSGYAKNGDGFWAKDGKVLELKWMANTGNKRREDTQALFIPELAKAGFKVVTDNSDADTVFQQRLPAGDYDFSMFIQVTSPDPTVTSILSTNNIPGPQNQGQGQNDWWYSNPDADKLMTSSDAELDVDKRAQQIQDLDKILREDYLNLPLYVFPAAVAWRPDKVAGPISEYINNPESVFWNMYDWSVG
jgi:peptide/nickel transport system substrate-binding protein